MYLSVVIPAYNEEKRLPRTLSLVSTYLSARGYDYEIIVVDDGSSDTTCVVVEKFFNHDHRVKIIKNTTNQGKGYSVKVGMLEAKGTFRLFMDADGSTKIDEVEGMLEIIKNHNSIVIGSRRVVGSEVKKDQPLVRIILGWIFRNIVNYLMPLNIIDTQNGFKLFTDEAAELLFKKQTVNGWAFDVEILYLAKKHGLRIVEHPVGWTNDLESKVRFSSMIKMLWDIIKIRIKS